MGGIVGAAMSEYRYRGVSEQGQPAILFLVGRPGAVYLALAGRRIRLDERAVLRLLADLGREYYRLSQGEYWAGPDHPPG